MHDGLKNIAVVFSGGSQYRIFGDTFRMLSNIRIAFYLLDKDMMIIPNLEYAEVIWSPYKKKQMLKLERI